MSDLFSDEELRAAAARVRAKAEIPPPPSTPLPTSFVYRPRTAAQWQRRIDQDRWSNHTFVPKPEPIIEDPEIENDCDDDDSDESPKAKVSSTTPCIDCAHPKKDHHTTPQPHMVDGEHAYYCVTSHCAVFSYRDGISAPCDCQRFRASETDMPKFTKPRVGPYDLCATRCTVRRMRIYGLPRSTRADASG